MRNKGSWTETRMDSWDRRLGGWSAAFLSLGIVLAMDSTAWAQLPLGEGEVVKVPFQNEWIDAVVIGQRGQNYGVRFLVEDKEQQALLNRRVIRKLCEVDALDFSRNWASKDGKFRVDAALQNIVEDSVELHKLDGTKITVPLASLSDRDVAYVKTIKKNIQAAAGDGTVATKLPNLPPLSKFPVPRAVEFSSRDMSPISLGKTPAALRQFAEAGVEFSLMPRHSISAMVPIGGPDQLILIGSGVTEFANIREPGQLRWLSMTQKKVVGAANLPPNHVPLDYNPDVKLLLTMDYNNLDRLNAAHYALWKVEPGGIELEPVKRWAAPPVASTLFAKVVSDRVVVIRVMASGGGGDCIAWDFELGTTLYSLRTFAATTSVKLTFDRKHLLVGGVGAVSILDATTGAIVSHVGIDQPLVIDSQRFSPGEVYRRRCFSVDLSVDGKRLVASTRNKIHVWNLEKGDMISKAYDISLQWERYLEPGTTSTVRWLDDDHVLLVLKSHHDVRTRILLFRLSFGHPIWFYVPEPSVFPLQNPRFSEIIDGKLFYLVDPTPNVRNDNVYVAGVVELPGPRVREATDNLRMDTLYAVRPGSRVRIRNMAVTVPTFVREQIMAKIEANGWIHDNQADNYFDLLMGDNSLKQYESLEQVKAASQNVPYCPGYSLIRFTVGNKTAWYSYAGAGIPADPDKWPMHNRLLHHFQDAQIPSHIVAPQFRFGVGFSTIGGGGIRALAELPTELTIADEMAELDKLNQTEEAQHSADFDQQ